MTRALKRQLRWLVRRLFGACSALVRRLFDPRLKGYWATYVAQAALATGALAIILVFADIVSGGSISRGILVAALGSTAFILFITPHSESARPRHALGGHLVALSAGALLGLVVKSQGKLNLGSRRRWL